MTFPNGAAVVNQLTGIRRNNAITINLYLLNVDFLNQISHFSIKKLPDCVKLLSGLDGRRLWLNSLLLDVSPPRQTVHLTVRETTPEDAATIWRLKSRAEENSSIDHGQQSPTQPRIFYRLNPFTKISNMDCRTETKSLGQQLYEYVMTMQMCRAYSINIPIFHRKV